MLELERHLTETCTAAVSSPMLFQVGSKDELICGAFPWKKILMKGDLMARL